MTKETMVIGGGIIFCAGVALGYVLGTKMTAKKSEPKEEPKLIEEDETTDAIPVEAPMAEPEEEKVIDYTKYNKIISEERYMAEAESPTDSDEDPEEPEQHDDNYIRQQCMVTKEELVKADGEAMQKASDEYAEGRPPIEPITREEFESDFSESSYRRTTFFYFPYEELLVDNDGVVIRIPEEWVGDFLDKEEYVRNNEKQLEIHINKDYPSLQDCDRF